MVDTDGLSAELRAWIASVTGAEVVRAERLVGGSSRESWFVDIATDGSAGGDTGNGVGTGRPGLVLRRETGGGPLSGTALSLAREAVAYQALQGSGIPVPRLHGVTDDGNAVLLDRVDGAAEFQAIEDPATKTAVAEDFMDVLAALHSLDTDELELPGFSRPERPEDHALAELELWEQILDERVQRPEPLARVAIRWLRDHAPTEVPRTVLVHGDAGPGNFLFDDGRVTAVLDWEFAHLGDPMDDLAWIFMRDHLQPFGDMQALLGRYADRSGIAIEPDRILFYRAVVLVRTMIACLVGIEAANPAMDPTPFLSSFPMFCRLLCQTLAELTGTPREATPIPAGSDPVDDVAATVARDLTGIVLPAISEPVAQRRAQGLVALVLHLGASTRLGAALEEAELDDLATVLGGRPPTVAAGWAQLVDIAAATDHPEALLPYLYRRADRQMALWAPALGPLADKPFPPIPQP